MNIECDERRLVAGDATLNWDQVTAVGIRTTADGPFADDCFWQFMTRDGGLVELPGALLGGEVFGRMLARLPGADLGKVLTAMACTDERVFRVWHAEDSMHAWQSDALCARFAALIERLGGEAAGAAARFEQLEAAWGGPRRRYHDREHLLDCLRELDSARGACGADARSDARSDIAELALWYHDAVYEPDRRDSEEQSARMLLDAAAALSVPRRVGVASAACVRATAHSARCAHAADGSRRTESPALEPPIDLVNDIDLAILGRDPLRFLEYEYAVAEEYALVWAPYYFLARGRLLDDLLASPAIYRTAYFRERYEAHARAQIEALLASPRYRLHRSLRRVRRWLARAGA